MVIRKHLIAVLFSLSCAGVYAREFCVAVWCDSYHHAPQYAIQAGWNAGKACGQRGYHMMTNGANAGIPAAVVDGYLSVNGTRDNLYSLSPWQQPRDAMHTEIPVWNQYRFADAYQFGEMCQACADCLVALPGGLNTLHAVTDALLRAQCGMSTAPLIIVNLHGFWTPLLDQVRHMQHQGTLDRRDTPFFVVVDTMKECFDEMMRIEDAWRWQQHDATTIS